MASKAKHIAIYEIETTSPQRTHHKSECYIIVCSCGRVRCVTGSGSIVLDAGSATVLLDGDYQQGEALDADSRAFLIAFDKDTLYQATLYFPSAFFQYLSQHPTLSLTAEQYTTFHNLCMLLKGYSATQGHAFQQRVMRNIVQNIFLDIFNIVRPDITFTPVKHRATYADIIIRDFWDLLLTYAQTEHEVRFYADRLCVTPQYLGRIVLRNEKCNVKEIIDNQIVSLLKSRLEKTVDSLMNIADDFCFSSPSVMGRFFKQHTGYSPLQYRKNLLSL